MKLSAVIFDLDGTVIQSEEEWAASFKKVLKELGVRVSEDYAQVGGIGVKENWVIFQKKYNLGKNCNLDELSSRTYQEFIKLIPKVTLTDGFLELTSDLKENGIKVALATSTEWWIVEKVFDALPIESLFDSVTTGDEVVNKKPEPDLFLKALDKLDIQPSECIVIEDAEAGTKAGKSAGMKVVALARDEKQKELLRGADLVVFGFNELSSSVLEIPPIARKKKTQSR